MRILMKTRAASSNGVLFPDKYYIVEDSVGRDFVEGNYAVEVDAKGLPVVEDTTVLEEIEEFTPAKDPAFSEVKLDVADPVFVDTTAEIEIVEDAPKGTRSKKG